MQIDYSEYARKRLAFAKRSLSCEKRFQQELEKHGYLTARAKRLIKIRDYYRNKMWNIHIEEQRLYYGG
jgi:hypothetical protein